MDLENLKGIGKTTIKYLNELGIENIKDLINYYPFRYEIIENSNINNIKDGDKIVIGGIIETIPTVVHFNRKLNKMNFSLNTSHSIINVTIFNRAFLKEKLNVGNKITVIGKYNKKTSSIMASDIKFGYIEKTLIEPIYHSSFKMSSSKISKIIQNAVATSSLEIQDYIPDTLKQKYHFMDKSKAIKIIHTPQDKTELNKALERMKYEELLLYMMKINYLKKFKNKAIGLNRKVNYNEVEKIIKKLPFQLTKDQVKSIQDIYEDLTNTSRMNRLLQGDVGSGKTIISFIALYINFLAGYQGALMAPTEILAYQHYNNFLTLFPNLNVILLTGKLKGKEKDKAKQLIENGEANIIIGTHALISEDVNYKNLGLVITDEQHRFGVAQRGNLKNKGISPDILYMSATPIPRTYALTLYGDMDISSIRTMPNGRKPVNTSVKSNKEIKDVLYMMLDQIKAHHQIYVIAPLIEENEKTDLENVYKLEEKMKKAFGKICNIGIMHGKMNNKEKEEVMNSFKENKIQILISTTVIEVGVDVPNATMIVIFDSYRFGLSALHQLRGRVGRNQLDGYCILISDKETKRLEILTHTNDGFKVSEEDFKLRGGGDIFGLRQSGDMNFKLANIKKDYDLLIKAKEDSEKFIKSQEYQNNKYDFLKEEIKKSINLD